jgi:hypothetical protein
MLTLYSLAGAFTVSNLNSSVRGSDNKLTARISLNSDADWGLTTFRIEI